MNNEIASNEQNTSNLTELSFKDFEITLFKKDVKNCITQPVFSSFVTIIFINTNIHFKTMALANAFTSI